MEKKNTKIILAVETSGGVLSVAASKPGGSAEVYVDDGRRHSELLTGACRYALAALGLGRADITLLAVCTGPGSFTGLRVGLAFCRTLAQALKIPLVGIPAFEVLARQARAFAPGKKDVCAVINSIGDDVYAGFFPAGKTASSFPYRVFSARKLALRLEKNQKSDILFVGSGSLKLKSFVRPGAGRMFPEEQAYHAPRAKFLAELAREQPPRRPPSKDSWKKVLPFYLRAPIAQERKNYRKKK